MLDEQTATVRPNADVTRVVAMLQSTAVLTELGGGSLWQHIDEALKASFEQCQPHVRGAGLWRKRTAERKSTVGPLRRYSAQSAAHADRRLRVSLSTDSTVNSAAAVRRSSARSSHHSEATNCDLQAHGSADRTERSTASNDDRTCATLRAEAAELRGATALPAGRRWADRPFFRVRLALGELSAVG